MVEASSKYFAWYQFPVNGKRFYMQGPYFTNWLDNGGSKKRIHSLEELRIFPFTKTVMKRLESARPGTQIQVHRVSLGTHLFIERLNNSDFDIWIDYQEAVMNLQMVNKKIYASVPKKLKTEKQELEKEVKNFKKKYSWI